MRPPIARGGGRALGIALGLAALGAAPLPAQDPPATDIFLFALGELDGWEPAAPVRLTDRDGYDNQPRFLADGSAILYTSIRDGQADVFRYTLADGRTTRLTETAESEYSPTPAPQGDRFTVVRVEADGRQRLWSFPLAGGEPNVVLPYAEPVGYHAWLGNQAVALFILGDPPTLRVADLITGEVRTLAEDIGRTLAVVPGSGHLSYVSKSEQGWWIKAFDPWIGRARTVTGTRPGSEDLVWTAAGGILMGEGSSLYLWRSGDSVEPWKRVADLGVFGLRGITRLALSPDQRHLAVVGERPPPAPGPVELE